VWGGKDITQGLRQVVLEFIPIRSDQLLGLYGPAGARPLLPEAQPNNTQAVAVTKLEVPAGKDSQGYLAVGNGNDFAVDVSKWLVKGAGAFTYTFPAGGCCVCEVWGV
jgi:hypothetical protein